MFFFGNSLKQHYSRAWNFQNTELANLSGYRLSYHESSSRSVIKWRPVLKLGDTAVLTKQNQLIIEINDDQMTDYPVSVVCFLASANHH